MSSVAIKSLFISSTPSSSALPSSSSSTFLVLEKDRREREREREMGNCQAIDAATLVIQHPNGKVEKLYCPVSASEIMKTNPGHYVALLISTTLCPTKPPGENTDKNSASSTTTTTTKSDHGTGAGTGGTGTGTGSVRLTRIKLLRPTDTLALGQVYRLITTQEVMKGLWAKKQAKLKRSQSDGDMRVEIIGREKPGSVPKDKNNQVIKHERHRPRTASASSGTPSAIASRPRTWQPSLHSISEGGTPNLQMRRNHTSPSS